MSSAIEYPLFSREGLLLLNNVFLVCAAAAVLLGTLYPMVVDALGLRTLSVGPPYFNAVFLPLMAPLAVLVGASGVVGWKRARAGEVWRKLRWPLVVAAVLGGLLPWLTQGQGRALAVIGSVLACWVLIGALHEVWSRVRSKRNPVQGLLGVPRAIWGMALAHLGLGVWTLGVCFTSLYSVERDVRLGHGDVAQFGDYSFRFNGVERMKGSNYDADVGSVTVLVDGQPVTMLSPEKRFYPSQRSVMTEAAVDERPLRDLYVSLGERLEDDDWSLRIYVKPMMRLVWWGGLIMAVGGVLAATDRRYRLALKRAQDAVVPQEQPA